MQRLENVPLFSAVRMGGNFSTSIITEDISGHHYLRSLRKIKILPRPKVSLESEISSERKGFRSNGHFLLTHPTSVNNDIYIGCKATQQRKDFQQVLSHTSNQTAASSEKNIYAFAITRVIYGPAASVSRGPPPRPTYTL